jgi:hypothetical protein
MKHGFVETPKSRTHFSIIPSVFQQVPLHKNAAQNCELNHVQLFYCHRVDDRDEKSIRDIFETHIDEKMKDVHSIFISN